MCACPALPDLFLPHRFLPPGWLRGLCTRLAGAGGLGRGVQSLVAGPVPFPFVTGEGGAVHGHSGLGLGLSSAKGTGAWETRKARGLREQRGAAPRGGVGACPRIPVTCSVCASGVCASNLGSEKRSKRGLAHSPPLLAHRPGAPGSLLSQLAGDQRPGPPATSPGEQVPAPGQPEPLMGSRPARLRLPPAPPLRLPPRVLMAL